VMVFAPIMFRETGDEARALNSLKNAGFCASLRMTTPGKTKFGHSL
jgi:hypothetical protein